MTKAPPRDVVRWLYWVVLALLPLIALWMAQRDRARPVVQTSARDLPAYHLIKEEDLRRRAVADGEVKGETQPAGDTLTGHYTRRAINANRPLLKDDVGPATDPKLMTDVLVVPIPMSAMLLQGDAPAPGAVVSVAALRQAGNDVKREVVLDEALVLDLTRKGDEQYIVLAVPAKAWPDYLSKTSGAKLVIAQRAR